MALAHKTHHAVSDILLGPLYDVLLYFHRLVFAVFVWASFGLRIDHVYNAINLCCPYAFLCVAFSSVALSSGVLCCLIGWNVMCCCAVWCCITMLCDMTSWLQTCLELLYITFLFNVHAVCTFSHLNSSQELSWVTFCCFACVVYTVFCIETVGTESFLLLWAISNSSWGFFRAGAYVRELIGILRSTVLLVFWVSSWWRVSVLGESLIKWSWSIQCRIN